jgi:futalosine hydrolase
MTHESKLVLGHSPGGGRWLLVVAARSEASAIAAGLGANLDANPMWRAQTIGDRFELLVSGVGKSNAAGATALALDPTRHGGVISLGIGGALPGEDGRMSVPLLSCVVGSASLLADEGVETQGGWASIAERGFAPSAELDGEPAMGVNGTAWLLERLGAIANHTGPIATVSTCSGADDRARSVRARTGALVEAMEGAAVGLAARRAWIARGGQGSAPFVEIRVVSNATGDNGAWKLREALAKLGEVARVL